MDPPGEAKMQITFTATDIVTGNTWTRTSGTMFYVEVLLVTTRGEDGSLDTGPYSWHRTAQACSKAMNSSYVAGFHARTGVRAVPTAISGKVSTELRDQWAADAEKATGLERLNMLAVVELIDAKLAGKPAKVATDNAEAARKAKAAADRRRQRAAKKAREEAAAGVVTGQQILDMAVEAAKVEAPAEPVKLHRSQKLVDGKVVWRNSGAKHNEYRRARRAALKAAKLAEQAS